MYAPIVAVSIIAGVVVKYPLPSFGYTNKRVV